MSAAGGSSAARAQALRAGARRGVWRRLLTAVGVTAHTRVADAQAAACDAGTVGEVRTQQMLDPLERYGWCVLHDRAIPGAHSANADHVLISPAGRAYLVDSKLWSAKFNRQVCVRDGRLMHGEYDRGKVVRSLLFETDLAGRALGVTVQPIIAVHNAPIEGGRFFVEGIPVLPAWDLVRCLVLNDGQRNAGAEVLAARARAVLPPYR